MLENFFQLAPIPADQMTGWYDTRLVALSYIVATFASYIALDITGRLRDISNTKSSIVLWLCGGALAMGAGIWSMHFIGMLAFKMDMAMRYDPSWTALSMVVAIAASGFALYILKYKTLHYTNIFFGGIILGLAIATMHYAGMQAMETNMKIRYLPGLFTLSIAVALFASEAALWLAIKSTQVIPSMRLRLKLVSALIMGAAICGMHYTGMAAAVFTPSMDMTSNSASTINPEILSIIVATVTFIILGVAFAVSTYKESVNQQLLLNARQAGMAEVAASVLHNVGNVLNSVNVSSNLISEKIDQSKLADLITLKSMIKENKHNFGKFLQEDPRGVHLPDFLCSLSDYWEKEQKLISSELKMLSRSVEHIRSIIATQQDLSLISGSEQVVSIANVIEESILISGIDHDKYAVHINKKLDKLNPVLIDKVKLLQILVNLLQNAKDVLIESKQNDKTIVISVKNNNDHFIISIQDNGPGIPKELLSKIFGYGFTTKKNGHGFGLHTSAISATEMGGALKVTSEGTGKGATFILQLPYNYR
jgi:NO-binding membrane sensor protein with MHYT domain/two-component sensor histidine kinase